MNYDEGIPKSEYLKDITRIFDRYKVHGFVDWRSCGPLEREAEDFLSSMSETLAKEGRYSDIFAITNKAYKKWSDTDKDDSDGETMFFEAAANDCWQIVYDADPADMPRKKMMKWFMKELEDHDVIDYMEDDLYDFLLKHFKEPDELKLKKEMLERIMPEVRSGDYGSNVLKEYYVEVLSDMKAPIEEIRSFIGEVNNYVDAELLAKVEMNYGNYDEAIKLYKVQIADRPDGYWSNKPRKALIEIYKNTGDKKAVLAEAREYLWTNVNSRDALTFYKAYFSKKGWPEEFKKIIADPRAEAAIVWFDMAGRYDLIMEKAEEMGDDCLIETYETELSARYPERCLKVLITGAKRSMQYAKKRSDYRYLAEKLRRISKYPNGREATETLAREFAEAYPRRRAMIDELKAFL